MGRYTGPRERLSRREGVDLELKGSRRLARKGALERRGSAPPGQHGRSAHRRPSVYALQLRAKQCAKRYYGVRERQFRNYVRNTRRGSEGQHGERLMIALERRLDNVVYRLGLATTRAQARQFVVHGHIRVDARRVTIPSYAVRPGELIALRTDSGVRPAAREAGEQLGRVAAWLMADPDRLCGTVVRLPNRAEIDAPVHEQLIVELYARATS